MASGGEKSMYGRKYMGVERTTFLIDAEGRIARVWRKVKVAGHAEEVLAAAEALRARVCQRLTLMRCNRALGRPAMFGVWSVWAHVVASFPPAAEIAAVAVFLLSRAAAKTSARSRCVRWRYGR